MAEHTQYVKLSADEDGRFLAERLVPGSWRIDTFPGKEELQEVGTVGNSLGGMESLSTQTVEVADGEEAFVVLGLPSAGAVSVHGRVLLGDQPVAAILQWTRLGSGGSQGTAMTRATVEGYAVELEGPGPWLASVSVSRPVSGRAEIAVRVPAVREHEVDLRLPGGSISGRVLSADGEPLEGARVSLRVIEGASHRSPLAMPGDFASADAEGRYAFRVLEPGTYAVATQGTESEDGEGFGAAAREDVVVPPDAPADGVDLVLEPGSKLRGFLRDADGLPVQGAALFAFDAAGRLLDPIAVTYSDERGWFATRLLAPGPVTLVGRLNERVSDPLLVDVPDAGGKELELVLRTGADLVVDWSAEDVDPRQTLPFVQVTDPDGRRWGGLREQRRPFEWRKDRSDPHLPRVGPLPLGTYRVDAALPDGRRASAEVTLAAPGEQRVRLELR